MSKGFIVRREDGKYLNSESWQHFPQLFESVLDIKEALKYTPFYMMSYDIIYVRLNTLSVVSMADIGGDDE